MRALCFTPALWLWEEAAGAHSHNLFEISFLISFLPFSTFHLPNCSLGYHHPGNFISVLASRGPKEGQVASVASQSLAGSSPPGASIAWADLLSFRFPSVVLTHRSLVSLRVSAHTFSLHRFQSHLLSQSHLICIHFNDVISKIGFFGDAPLHIPCCTSFYFYMLSYESTLIDFSYNGAQMQRVTVFPKTA